MRVNGIDNITINEKLQSQEHLLSVNPYAVDHMVRYRDTTNWRSTIVCSGYETIIFTPTATAKAVRRGMQ